MKQLLIEKLFNQLEKSKPNSEITQGRFSDDSASWIEVRPKVIDLKKPYLIVETLSFNGKGTKLEDIGCYKEIINISFDSEKIV